ncbi:MAG: TolC family protein [Odoribacteraceae bacterium]|jgi:outer membrane protein TolC|nr:TolC family protein [Odoribacteraceae bacterium]
MHPTTLLLLLSFLPGENDTISLTPLQAVEMAREQSPDALYARHAFRSAHWNHVYYKASRLPSLSIASTPRFNHAINPVTLPDGTARYISQNQLTTDISLSLDQNIPFTGGTLSLQTGIQRMDMFGEGEYSYKTAPLVVVYAQSLAGYNRFKWDKRVEPLRFEEARRDLAEALELASERAVSLFFNLARAQANLDIARVNHANADTLHAFARGRYEIGAITENEILQLEINMLTEESNRLSAALNVDDCMEALRAFLGIDDPRPILAVIDDNIPLDFAPAEEALARARENSAEIPYMKRQEIESESSVASARANAGTRADLYIQFGLAKTGKDLEEAYRHPLGQQYMEIGVRLPLLDWGRGRGQVEVARSNRDMVRERVARDRSTFEMNVIKTVKQFNLQANQLRVAAKANETAARRGEVARKLYLLGKSTILDLNASITEKDAARRNFLSTLATYWSLYYALRSLTLFDFEQGTPLAKYLETPRMGIPQLHMGNPHVRMGNPHVRMGNPQLRMGNPQLHMGNPHVHMGNPHVHMGNPHVRTGIPHVRTGNPLTGKYWEYNGDQM